ncbi:MAG: hypothetical protein KAI39_05920, partial [Desulfobulbaceae bacterium]|nr:hypothetical protein [Desulfobulbaceae bacterium]
MSVYVSQLVLLLSAAITRFPSRNHIFCTILIFKVLKGGDQKSQNPKPKFIFYQILKRSKLMSGDKNVIETSEAEIAVHWQEEDYF